MIVLSCLYRISAWCPPANFQSSGSSISPAPTFSKSTEGILPIRTVLSIKLSEKRREALLKKHQQITSVNQERLPESLEGGPLGVILKEKEEWVFIVERFAALDGKMLLLR